LNIEEWVTQAGRIRSLWQRSGDWDSDTVKAYFERLSWLPADAVALAIDELADEGARTAPSVGEIRKRAAAHAPKREPVCTCFESIGAYRNCKSGHAEGFIERRQTAEQAHNIVQQGGGMVDPGAYDGELSIEITAAILRHFYDGNIKAGRLLDDPGDEHGCPTMGKNAGCLLGAL
jgi:hypothetical protein